MDTVVAFSLIHVVDSAQVGTGLERARVDGTTRRGGHNRRFKHSACSVISHYSITFNETVQFSGDALSGLTQ